MARQKAPVLTEAEQRIMEVLWTKREATVRDVVNELSAQRPLAYTTVLTTLRVLRDKGYLRARAKGRAFVYRPIINQTRSRSRAFKHMLAQFFGCSAEAFALHLL